MSRPSDAWRPALALAALTLRLNARNPQALVFGYVVPVFFLIAFGSVFGSSGEEMLRSLAKVLTIAVLGGACFGLPIALVAERERGVWRRYRLSPVGAAPLVTGVILARLLLLLGAGVLVVGVAGFAYHMPWPARPCEVLAAFLAVSLAFIGVGLLIAAIATSVAAVQALGQCLFLPMLIIGGVAVPLNMLPAWAEHLSRFMPGRYAVQALNHALVAGGSLANGWFPLLALLVMGGCSAVAGTWGFRWDVTPRRPMLVAAMLAIGLSGWVAMGIASELWR